MKMGKTGFAGCELQVVALLLRPSLLWLLSSCNRSTLLRVISLWSPSITWLANCHFFKFRVMAVQRVYLSAFNVTAHTLGVGPSALGLSAYGVQCTSIIRLLFDVFGFGHLEASLSGSV